MLKHFAYLGALLAALLGASEAAAQPVPWDVRAWYIYTSRGLVGYRETEFLAGEHYHYLFFGPLGGLEIAHSEVAIAAAVLTGLVALVCSLKFVRIRRRRKLSHVRSPKESVDARPGDTRKSTG